MKRDEVGIGATKLYDILAYHSELSDLLEFRLCAMLTTLRRDQRDMRLIDKKAKVRGPPISKNTRTPDKEEMIHLGGSAFPTQ